MIIKFLHNSGMREIECDYFETNAEKISRLFRRSRWRVNLIFGSNDSKNEIDYSWTFFRKVDTKRFRRRLTDDKHVDKAHATNILDIRDVEKTIKWLYYR